MRLAAAVPLLLCLPSVFADPNDYFGIRVIDDATGRGVPLIELRTVNSVRLWTDSAGWVAFQEPGLMNRKVYFHVAGHGYEHPRDGFGYRGKALVARPGHAATLRVKRVNIAERLYRVTGGGIYRDSLLLGRPPPIAEPALNALVFGQDSVVNAVYRDAIYWFWGDTSRPAYPLGNFEVAGAASQLPRRGGLDPDVGVNLDYFIDETGFARKMAPLPGPGPTWIDGLVVLTDDDGQERLFAAYAKVDQQMKARGRGLLLFDDAAAQFKCVAKFDPNAPIQPGGHAIIQRDADATTRVYYTRPFPVIRTPAQPDALADLANYECYTCLAPGSNPEKPELLRGDDGALAWGWRREAPPLLPRVQEQLINDGRIRPHEARFRLLDIVTGDAIIIHGGSIYWNDYRRRWILVGSQIFGASMLGEVWFAEADDLLGPWRFARKTVTHDRYSFYNPKQHPMLDQDGGRRIYFEGTYTATFSGNDDKTPRYDYNQIMYRLDLTDERLALPTAVYRRDDGGAVFGSAMSAEERARAGGPAFFALDRPVDGCVAVVRRNPTINSDSDAARHEWVARPAIDAAPDAEAIFYALPADVAPPPPNTTPLCRYQRGDEVVYAIEADDRPAGFARCKPLCTVWTTAGGAARTPACD